MAATISSLPHAVMSASALLSIGVGLGALLEYLASHRVLGLHRVPLGPGGGADITLASIGSAGLPAPYGHHGWLPVPLGLIDVALLWNAAPVWDSSSWWSTCRGPLWGQLASLAVCLLGVLPAVLAAWLLWMPWRCSALPCALAALLAALAALATLFWADALPLLPRARLTAPCARAALRRSVLYLLHPAYFAARVATAQPEAYDGCTTLSDQLAREPDAVLGSLRLEMAAQTPQGMMSAGHLCMQVLVACLAIFIVIDTPRGASEARARASEGKAGEDGSPPPLWGAAD